MKGAWEWMQFLHKFTFHKCGKLKVDWALQEMDGMQTLALYGSTDNMDWLLSVCVCADMVLAKNARSDWLGFSMAKHRKKSARKNSCHWYE